MQRLKSNNLGEPTFHVVTLITLALEHYLKALLSVTTCSGRLLNEARKKYMEETTGQPTLQQDLMDTEDIATTAEHAKFLHSLANIYGQGDPMEVVTHR